MAQDQEKQQKQKQQLEEDRKQIGEMIQFIAFSPFGRTPTGWKIVTRLRSLHDSSGIVYGETYGDRGSWDGRIITIKERFRGRFVLSVASLVHEATHAVDKHPLIKDEKARRKNNVDDEERADENEIAIYKYMKDYCGLDQEHGLDLKMQHQADGTLREVIEKEFH